MRYFIKNIRYLIKSKIHELQRLSTYKDDKILVVGMVYKEC